MSGSDMTSASVCRAQAGLAGALQSATPHATSAAQLEKAAVAMAQAALRKERTAAADAGRVHVASGGVRGCKRAPRVTSAFGAPGAIAAFA